MRSPIVASAVALLMLAGCASGPGGRRPVPDKLVVLTFDDSVKSHATVAAPLLRKYGFGATFFITEGFNFPTNKMDYMTWEEIRSLHEQGFEIGNHTRDHMSLTAANLPRLGEQIDAINARCAEHGIPPTVSFAYCGNDVLDDGRVFQILREAGIIWARRGTRPEQPAPTKDRPGFPYEPAADHPLFIPSAGIPAPGYTLEDFIRSVSMARDGKIAVLQFHGVPEGEHPWVHVEKQDFEAFMKYLHDHDYTVIAMRDLARYVDPTEAPDDAMAVVRRRQQEMAPPTVTPRPGAGN
jgi:peptidoglycan-N-acetylglucosamine deacetylase